MFCKKCGNQLDDNAMFCPNCGEKCSADVDAVVEQNKNESQKLSMGERLLRILNIATIVITAFVSFINFASENIVGGIITVLIPILLIVFVFRKKQMSKIKNKIASVSARKWVVTLIYLLLPAVMFASIGISTAFESSDAGNDTVEVGNTPVDYKSIAMEFAERNVETDLKSSLKNPNSLQINGYSVYSRFETENYWYYSIAVDYSAQNGFGGYNRDNYKVSLKINKNSNLASKVTDQEYADAYVESKNNNK